MYNIKKSMNLEHVTLDLYITYLLKIFYQRLFFFSRPKQQILMIVGCQRSGTSLVNRVFARDFNISVYRESSCLSSNDLTHTGKNKLRLNTLQLVESNLLKDKSPTIVLKPLVESQNILSLLDFFPQSKALWMYRDYRDVSNSFLNKFSQNVGIRNIKAIVNGNDSFWYSESVAQSVRSTVIKHYSNDIQPADAIALFWYVRNMFFYELDLDVNPRVMMCRYEQMVEYPHEFISQVYSFLGKKFKSRNIWEVNSNSVYKGRSIEITEDIKNLCDGLLTKLDQTFTKQMNQKYLTPTLS